MVPGRDRPYARGGRGLGAAVPPKRAGPEAEIARMLEANEEGARRFPGSKPVRPARKVAVVACMDSRMPLFGMLGLDIGDAHVIRNAGGVITEDVIRSLTISQHALGTREIVLVHH